MENQAKHHRSLWSSEDLILQTKNTMGNQAKNHRSLWSSEDLILQTNNRVQTPWQNVATGCPTSGPGIQEIHTNPAKIIKIDEIYGKSNQGHLILESSSRLTPIDFHRRSAAEAAACKSAAPRSEVAGRAG